MQKYNTYNKSTKIKLNLTNFVRVMVKEQRLLLIINK